MSLPLSYPEAIDLLNKLQTYFFIKKHENDAVVKLNGLPLNVTSASDTKNANLTLRKINMQNTLEYLAYTGVSSDDLNQLSVIHIAGTKGKGSTSALCESILRSHGFKTGLYTSPHMVSVTERIRIDGKPMGKEYFADVFTEIYEDLKNNKGCEEKMPTYFAFLTIMAFKVFLMEEVDVAIVEVGIGGKFDMTNIVSNVPVVGITSLGLEHTAILGNTIKEIAEQKAGIFKPGCKAYTVPQQHPAMNVLFDKARKSLCSLSVVPSYEAYNWIDVTEKKYSRPENPTIYRNASLAIQLAHSWMNQRNHKVNNSRNRTLVSDDNSNIKIEKSSEDIVVNVPKKTFDGIQSSFWPGRCQIIRNESADIYIDGAHTVESIELCADWFKSHWRESSYRVLIFHVTKDRNAKPLLEYLTNFKFNMALFVPNVAYDANNPKASIDQVDLVTSIEKKMITCAEHSQIWQDLITENNNTNSTVSTPIIQMFTNVSEALNHIYDHCRIHEHGKPQILITGSLLLVGAALSILDPLLTNSQKVS